jgi:hypothetical protein
MVIFNPRVVLSTRMDDIKLTKVKCLPDGIADTPCSRDDVKEGWIITRWLPE